MAERAPAAGTTEAAAERGTAGGTSACPLCGSPSTAHLVTGYDRMHAFEGDFDYARCGSCGLVFRDPLPAPEAIPGLYADEYPAHTGGGRHRRRKWINRMAVRYHYGTGSVDRPAPLRWAFRLLSRRVLRHLRPPRGGNRLLDVGCGAGNLLLEYRDLGWSAAGVETSPRACAVARSRGLDVHEGTVHDAPFEQGSFDLIVLSHVIEHVLEPDRFLAACGRLLAPEGILVVSTPNARALGFRLYGSCWFPLEAPRHLMLFDSRTIRLLAERAGLRPRRIRTLPNATMLADSRHYARTQGARLPADPGERRRVVESSAQVGRERRGFRRFVGPLSTASSWFGRGEVLEAELSR